MFVLARDVRAPTIDEGRVVHVPARAPVRPARRSASSAGPGSSPRRSPAGRPTPPSRRCSCGSTAGSGIALLSALLFPVWEWLDPFATLHDIARLGAAHRLGVRGWAASERAGGGPRSGRPWSGSLFFVWLELVRGPRRRDPDGGPRRLHGAHARAHGPVRARRVAGAGRDVLGLVPDAQPAGAVRRRAAAPHGEARRRRRRRGRRSIASASSAAPVRDRPPRRPRGRRAASRSSRVGIALDHLRRPVADGRVRVGVRRARRSCRRRSSCSCCSAIVAGAALAVGRAVSSGAIGAGLLPIAVGYLIAHYLTYLLIDGQRIVDRRLRPAPAGLGPVRDGVLPARRSTGCRPASSGRSSWRRSWAATCSARGRATSPPSATWSARRGAGRRATCAIASCPDAHGPDAAQRADARDPARRGDGRADHDHAVVAGPGDRRRDRGRRPPRRPAVACRR